MDESNKPAQGAALIMEKFQRMIQGNSSKHVEVRNESNIPGFGFELPSKVDSKGKSPGFNQVSSVYCSSALFIVLCIVLLCCMFTHFIMSGSHAIVHIQE